MKKREMCEQLVDYSANANGDTCKRGNRVHNYSMLTVVGAFVDPLRSEYTRFEVSQRVTI